MSKPLNSKSAIKSEIQSLTVLERGYLAANGFKIESYRPEISEAAARRLYENLYPSPKPQSP